MRRLVLQLSLLVACAAVAGGAAGLAPAINWVAPLFTKDNFHSMTLRGAKASFPTATEVVVEQLSITVFSGDAAKKVETTLLSPAATFQPRQQSAHGEAGVEVIRADLAASGTRWHYDHLQKKVSLTGHVRIVFNAEIQHLIK